MKTLFTALILALSFPLFLLGHHFKGLPHYGYFDNYPQTPPREFPGQIGPYKLYLVIYDFQGLTKKDMEQPNDVRLFLTVYHSKKQKAYSGALKLDILDGKKTLRTINFTTPQEENLYKINTKLGPDGGYSLKVTLSDKNDIQTTIPFTLSSQKVSWGLWIGISLFILIVVAGIASRKVKKSRDRQRKPVVHGSS